MAKDKSKLESISDYFTEDTLKDILCKLCNKKDAEVSGWNFDTASAKGDSYLSTVNKIQVTGIVDGEEKEVSIVVKSLPKNLGRRKTYRSAEFFYNEIMFYSKIVPKFEEFLKKKGQPQVLCIPRYLGSHIDGENDYIALENMAPLGFEPVSRQDCIDVTQCTLIVKALARFHAISFAFKDQDEEEFGKLVEYLRETYFDDRLRDWYKRFHQRLIEVAQDALAKEYPGSAAGKRFSSYTSEDFYKMGIEFCSHKSAPTSVINQGDSWAPNFLARNSGGKEEALMLDFQLARCGSPILDLSFSIYACTNKTFRDQYFDRMLRIYHNELSETIALLGSNPKKIYPWQTFMDEVKQQFVFGMIFSLEAVPFSLLDESQAFELDTLIKDDNAVDIADVWTLSNIESKSGRRRLADVIVHATERSFLQPKSS